MASYGRTFGASPKDVSNKMSNLSVNPEPTMAEVVAVPPELNSYVQDPKFSAVMLKIKEQSGVNFLAVTKSSNGDGAVSIAIDSSTTESGQHARMLLELKFKHQAKIAQSEEKLKRTQEDLFSTQGSLAAGHIVEFDVPREVIGLIIGKKGARVRQVEEDTGVQSIRVIDQADKGRVVIVGKDAASVRKAREQMEVRQESFPVSPEHLAFYRREGRNMSLNDLRETAGLSQVDVDWDNQCVIFRGTVPSLKSARLLMDVHMENVCEILALESKQRDANRELHEVKSKFTGGRGDGPRRDGGRKDTRDRTRQQNVKASTPATPPVASIPAKSKNTTTPSKVVQPAVVETTIPPTNSSKQRKKKTESEPAPAAPAKNNNGSNGSKAQPPPPADYVSSTAAALESISVNVSKRKDQKSKDKTQVTEAPVVEAPKSEPKKKDTKAKDKKTKEAPPATEAPVVDPAAPAAEEQPLPKRNGRNANKDRNKNKDSSGNN